MHITAEGSHPPYEAMEVVLSTLIGLDIGGTSLKAVRLNARNEITARATLPAGGEIGREELARRIVACVRELSEGGRPRGVGLCFGGLLQDDGTMRAGSTNLSNLDGIPLKEFFGQLLGMPCRIENDAIAAMRGEAGFGAARGLQNAMTMTFGSGIGSGLLLNSHIHQGTHQRAGEIGVWHLAADSDNSPTLEDIAAPGRFFRHHGVQLADLLRIAPSDEAARVKSRIAISAIGVAIADVHLLLDLEAVILTGGITALGDVFVKPVRAAYEASCPVEYHQGLEIRIGELGVYAGAVGAAALWLKDPNR
jgi:glucokinase